MIHEALGFGKAVYHRRTILSMTITESADLRAASFTADSTLKQLILGVPRALPVVTSRRGYPSWQRPARRGVKAAALTKLMLTVLSLAGGTAPPRPCSRQVTVDAHGERRVTPACSSQDRHSQVLLSVHYRWWASSATWRRAS